MTWEQEQEWRQAAPLWHELAGNDGCDEDWNRANVARFVSCVGMVDHRHCDGMWADPTDPRWDEDPNGENAPRPEATCLIAVADTRWLAHLAPGMEWNSTAYDHDPEVKFDSACRTDTVTQLATGIYESRDFSAMPILADALQDAGCDSDDLLNHLRDPHATHVRGCWALDLVLGKS